MTEPTQPTHPAEPTHPTDQTDAADPAELSSPPRGPEDVKAKMREALARKQANDRGVPEDGPVREKAHGSEVTGGAGPKMHRRKAGGGGS